MFEDLLTQISTLPARAKAVAKIPLVAIIGPTASGKTDLSIVLAEKFKAEIISADSRQIYRGMDIGTAKPTPAQLQKIPHRLIDIADPDQTITLAEYKKLAEQAIVEIYSKNKLPFLVGGTGLYISALTQAYSLPDSPPDPRLRKELENLAASEGPEKLHQLLKEIDPLSAEKIPPQNLRYVIRAIEIAKSNSAPKNDQRSGSPYLTLLIGIEWPREELYRRINLRIDQQLDLGLVNETKTLLAKYSASLPALSSIGYHEIGSFLEGKTTLEAAVNLFKQHTRNFAKRQLTWFRKFQQVYWIPGSELANFIESLNS